MGITANSGPIVTYGSVLNSTNGITGTDVEYNSARGPSLFDLGHALLDPRAAYNYTPAQAANQGTYGFYANAATVDFQPSSASSNALLTNTAPTTGLTFTLTPSSAKGTYSTTIVAPENGQTVSVIAIDSTAAYLAFGQDGTSRMWNPAAGTGRCISITTSSNLDAGGYTISGRDMYGFKMTETVLSSAAQPATSLKAFKYISSITASTTVTSTGVIIGLSDTYGFPFKVSYCGFNTDVRLLASAYSSAVAVALSSANVALASTAATQTSTTPDVRGTYASSTASNATVRLQMVIRPTVNAMAALRSSDMSALFGATQYSSV